MTRVLVVDDEKSVRRALCEFLQLKGYIIADAESGPLALAAFPLFHPDLVLLDILMPGMSGTEVLKQLKQWDPNLCVIMLTGVNDLKIARDVMQQGANDYLTKPFKFEQLEILMNVHGLFRGAEQ